MYLVQEIRYHSKDSKEVVIYKLVDNEYIRYGIVTYPMNETRDQINKDLRVKIDKWLPYITTK